LADAAAIGFAACPGRALLDLIEECEQEEARQRAHPAPVEEEATAETSAEASTKAVEALVTLVRREVRVAVDREFLALTGRQPAPSQAPLEVKAPQPHQLPLLPCRRSGSSTDSGSGRPVAMAPSEECFDRSAPVSGERCGSEWQAVSSSTSASSCPGSPLPRERRNPEAGPGSGPADWLRGAEEQLAEHRQVLASLQEALASQALHWDGTWKSEAELRAEGDQEVEARLAQRWESRLGAVEVQVEQVQASVGSLARLQVELGAEAKLRQDADGRLQAFLRDFRGHIVSEVEELWTRQQGLSEGVESVRGLVTRALGLPADTSEGKGDECLASGCGGHAHLRGGGKAAPHVDASAEAPPTGRVTGPDELEGCGGGSRHLPLGEGSGASPALSSPPRGAAAPNRVPIHALPLPGGVLVTPTCAAG